MLTPSELCSVIESRDSQRFASTVPYGSLLQDVDVLAWFDEVQPHGNENQHAFHEYVRLHGIQDDESIACVVQYAQDKGGSLFDPQMTPTDLVETKLLKSKRVPHPDEHRTAQMRSSIIDLLVKQTDCLVRDDLAAMIADTSGKVAGHEWMRGRAPLVVQMPNQRVYMCVTNAPEVASEEFPFKFVCQLHHLRELSIHAGIKTDGMLLVNFDWPSYRVLPLAVPHQAELTEAIYVGGDALWAKIKAGSIPSRPVLNGPAWIAVGEDIQAQVADLEARYLGVHLLESRVTAQKHKIADDLSSVIRAVPNVLDHTPDELGLSLLKLEVDTVVHEEAMRAFLKSRKLSDRIEDITAVDSPSQISGSHGRVLDSDGALESYVARRFDPKKTIALLSELGVSLHAAKEAGLIEQSIIPVYDAPHEEGYQKDAHETLDCIARDAALEAMQRVQAETQMVFSPDAAEMGYVGAAEAYTPAPNMRVIHDEHSDQGVKIAPISAQAQPDTEPVNEESMGEATGARQAAANSRADSLLDWSNL
jgi:hypothetical protein